MSHYIDKFEFPPTQCQHRENEPCTLCDFAMAHRTYIGNVGNMLHEPWSTPDHRGYYVTCERGSLHKRKSGLIGATWGAIRDTWANLGWESGWLGFPVSSEKDCSEYDQEAIFGLKSGDFEYTYESFCNGEPDPLVAKFRGKAIDPSYARVCFFEGGAIMWLRHTQACECPEAFSQIKLFRRIKPYYRGCPDYHLYTLPTLMERFLDWL